jgi:tetratricopeptide (TPR) repeat protein
MSQQYSFSLPYESFDLELAGLDKSDVGTAAFQAKVAQFFAKQFASFRGKACVICDDQSRTIHVSWSKDPGFIEPLEQALELLRGGKIQEAIPILWTAHQQNPSSPDILYNLGVAYNEVGLNGQSIQTLAKLLEIAPNHVHGLAAMGVAYMRGSQLLAAADYLEKAIELDPNNLWALRNLAACRIKQGRAELAVELLKQAIRLAPNDIQTLVSYGTALEEAGHPEDADDQYLKAIKVGGPPSWVDLAKTRRTELAQKVLRKRGGDLRPDVMMYITGSLERFAEMKAGEIQAIGVEIATLGQNGLDINDPEKKYRLRSLPGTFSGLHLVAIMYTAFQQIAPGTDVGIDFSREYEAAKELSSG